MVLLPRAEIFCRALRFTPRSLAEIQTVSKKLGSVSTLTRCKSLCTNALKISNARSSKNHKINNRTKYAARLVTRKKKQIYVPFG